MQEFSRSLPMLLYRALDTVMPRFRRIFSDFGLTEQQWRVLRVLWERDDMPLGTLAGLTLIPAPSLVGVVRRLQSQGLVARHRSDRDRRVVFVQLTSAGREIQSDVQPRVRSAYRELRDSIPEDDWNRLVAGLESLAGAQDGLRADTWDR